METQARLNTQVQNARNITRIFVVYLRKGALCCRIGSRILKMYHIYIYGSFVSIAACLIVCLSYYIYTRAFPWRKSQSYMYGFRLVVVNGTLGLVTLLWDFVTDVTGDDTSSANKFCRAYLPVPIYFFLCGFGEYRRILINKYI